MDEHWTLALDTWNRQDRCKDLTQHPYRPPRYAFPILGKASGRRDYPHTSSNRMVASCCGARSSGRRFTKGQDIHTGGQEATHSRHLLPVPCHRSGRTATVYGHCRDCGEDGRGQAVSVTRTSADRFMPFWEKRNNTYSHPLLSHSPSQPSREQTGRSAPGHRVGTPLARGSP